MIELHTIGIVVRDMGASLAFYRTLGLPIPVDQEAEDNVDIALPDGITLGFLTEELARRADPGLPSIAGQRLNLQFRCATPGDVDATHAAMLAAGYSSHTAPWDAFWGQRFARLIDPNDLIVNVFAPLV